MNPGSESRDITRLLWSWRAGDGDALDELRGGASSSGHPAVVMIKDE